jgi:hypothetical protein
VVENPKDLTIQQKKCNHVVDENSIEFDSRYGRRGVCKYCGTTLVQYRIHRPDPAKQGKVKMSKKQRKRIKKQIRESKERG